METNNTDFALYEIDPKKKYVLSCEGNMPTAQIERITVSIREWLESDKPFLIINGSYVKLVKIEDAESVRE